jgi:hypothetical protein
MISESIGDGVAREIGNGTVLTGGADRRLGLERLMRSLKISEKSRSGRVLAGFTKPSFISTVVDALVDKIRNERLQGPDHPSDAYHPDKIAHEAPCY